MQAATVAGSRIPMLPGLTPQQQQAYAAAFQLQQRQQEFAAAQAAARSHPGGTAAALAGPMAAAALAMQQQQQRAASSAAAAASGAGGGVGGGGEEEGDGHIYCICQRPAFGEMVGCDNDSCPKEWFHLTCVGLTKAPEGSWFCPECAKNAKKGPKPKAARGRGR